MTIELPTEPLELLRQNRMEVVPFIGAGLSPAASTATLTTAVRERAALLDVPVDANDLLSLSMQLEKELGLSSACELIAAAVQSLPTGSTPTLEVLARCSSRVIVTFNYDDSIEQAILATGQIPKPLLPNTAEVFRNPSEGEVAVVHLHGSAHEPDTLVLPGLLTEVLNEDDAFKGALRHLWLRHLVVYLGFRLGPAETHLRAALGWLVNGMRDVNPQLMFLPRSEYESRGEELRVLSANPFFTPVPYPDSPDHQAVHFVALVIAPRNEPTSDVVQRRAPLPVPYFLPPQIEIGGTGTEVFSSAPPERLLRSLRNRLVRSRRVVIDGRGGMGKTQLLLALGTTWGSAHSALYAPLDRLAAILDDDEPITASFARFAGHADSFNDQAPRPSLERLETGRFAFLLDGFDEVAVRRRPAVAEAIAEVAATWTQHVFIVASRPIGVESLFARKGFEVVEMTPSTDWGKTYLERRGVSGTQISEALERFGEVATEMIAVPMQAAHVGESLVRGMEVPTRPIDFAVEILHDLAVREARNRGWPEAALITGLERLAFALTFSDVREASEKELSTICQLGVDSERLKAVLVEAGLLKEVGESGLSFPTRTQQEALAANFVLRSNDLLALLLDVAVVRVGARVRTRPFLEQVLDWIWESAPIRLRPQLFDLDSYRYLRTLPSELSANLADQALNQLWQSHVARNRLLGASGDRALGSLATALHVVSENHQEVVSKHRTAWQAATNDQRPAVRANAIFLLINTAEATAASFGADARTAWLMLGDDDRQVRLKALDAVTQLKEAGVARLIWETLVRFPEDRYQYAQAMIDVAQDDEMDWIADAVLSAAASAVSIERLLGLLDLPAAIQALEHALFDRGAAGLMAVGILGSWSVDQWTGDLAERYFLAVEWPPGLNPSHEGLDETLPSVADSSVRALRLDELREVFDDEFARSQTKAEELMLGTPRDTVEFDMGRRSVFHRPRLAAETSRGARTRPGEELNAQDDLEAHRIALEALPRHLADMAVIADKCGLAPLRDNSRPE